MTLWKFVRTSTKHKLDNNDDLDIEDANGSRPPEFDNGSDNNGDDGGQMRARDAYVSSNRCVFFFSIFLFYANFFYTVASTSTTTTTNGHPLKTPSSPASPAPPAPPTTTLTTTQTRDERQGWGWWRGLGLGLETVASRALGTFFFYFLCTILTVHRFSLTMGPRARDASVSRAPVFWRLQAKRYSSGLALLDWDASLWAPLLH